MKLSFYNKLIKYDDDYFLFYNSFSNACLIIPTKVHDEITKNEKNIIKLKETNLDFFDTLYKNGFIIDSSLDEKAVVLLSRETAKYNTYKYHVIINPTMDCNLACWYCYETKTPKSALTNETLENLKKHFVYKYETEPYKELKISLFGGEPLLETPNVVDFITFIKEFTKSNNVKLHIETTTNATLIKDDFLKSISDCSSSFQITIDGNKIRHDNIRKYKSDNKGTFDTIISNIKKIHDSLEETLIRIRINFDLKTLDNIETIFKEFEILDRKKILITFHKVWQVTDQPLDPNKLINIINSLLDKGFLVDYYALGRQHLTCYADVYNQILINYDGQIFKCTSRDFNKEKSEGLLLNDGSIEWKHEKLWKRMNTMPLDKCIECNLLPSCSAVCSENLMDKKGVCYIEHLDMPFEDFMAYNFKKNIVSNKIHGHTDKL